MTGYNFTDNVRRSLQYAREEALALGHEYVGTEHILLGLLRCEPGVAIAAIAGVGCDRGALRQTVLGLAPAGAHAAAAGPDLPYTARAKKVLELAMTEARELGHDHVGTQHVLLGVVREERGIGAQALARHGVEIDTLRAETLRLLAARRGDRRAPPAPLPAGPISVTVTLEHPGGRLDAVKFRTIREAIDYLSRLGGR